MKQIIIFVITAVLFMNCTRKEESKPQSDDKKQNKDYQMIEETMMSPWNMADNTDSPAFYKNGENAWILATMKETDGLMIYDAVTGEVIKTVGKSGTGQAEFERPNGIWVIDDMVLVTERDNHRVQVLSLPEFKFIGYIGTDKLKRPYGLSVYKEDGNYELYITDQYEEPNEQIPADSLLDERVLHYRFNTENGSFNAEFVRYIGETQGEGVLHTVESIFADPQNNKLMIAEETEAYTHIKVYDLKKGTYIKGLGKDLFEHQAEGIALYDCGNGKGFWFFTDQFTGDNTYHIFSRKDLKYIKSFRSENTQNTDGVWLTQQSYENHPQGSFIMVNNDGGIGVYEMQFLMNELELSCD